MAKSGDGGDVIVADPDKFIEPLPTTNIRTILKAAIQVAPRPRKGNIPPESASQHRALTSLLPETADTGPQGEAYVSHATGKTQS